MRMKPMAQAMAGILFVGAALAGVDAHAGRRKAPRPAAPEVHLPDASPGSVEERGYATDADHVMMDHLGFALRLYAFGMRRYIEEAAAAASLPPDQVSAHSLSVFTRQLRTGTLALFEYSWTEGGEPRRRTYIARSNRRLEQLLRHTRGDLQAPVLPEEHFLPASSVMAFAREPVPVPGSLVVPLQGGVNNRDNDAEIKALQLLMAEMRANPGMRGGQLTGFVSQQPCESCSPALRLFAREAHASVYVNYVYGGPGRERETPLYRSLRQAREQAIALLEARFPGGAPGCQGSPSGASVSSATGPENCGP